MEAPELEAVVQRLVQEVEHLKERLETADGPPTLEAQHQVFVARLREREEE